MCSGDGHGLSKIIIEHKTNYYNYI